MRFTNTPVLSLLMLMLTSPMLRADEAPHARAYLDLLGARLTLIDTQMPTISRAAEQAAKAIHAGRGLGVRGDAGLANELSNRAGALLGYDGRPGKAGGVIVYVFGLATAEQHDVRVLLVKQINEADQLKAGGSVVIGIGSVEQLSRYGLQDVMEEACAAFLDNGVALNRKRVLDGEEVTDRDLADDVSQVVPMATVLNAAVAWAFECELFSALTRLDKVPIVRRSFEIDTRQRRWQRYGSQRFHHDRWLDPISPGLLGRAYLDGLRDVLRDIGTASWRSIAKTAHRADNTLASGGIVWLRAGGRYLPYHVGGQLAADPGMFTVLNHDGSDPKLAVPGKHDFVIAVGESETAGSYEWGEPGMLRGAGRGVAWIINGYNTQRRDLHRREILIDLWAPFGDCVVRVEDYDTPLGPVNSVVGEAVMWMITAEVLGRKHAWE